MADTCPVVRIKAAVCEGNPDGYTEINESDFDPAVHEKYKEPKPSKAAAKPVEGAE